MFGWRPDMNMLHIEEHQININYLLNECVDVRLWKPT